MRRVYFVAILSLLFGSYPVHGQTPTSTPTLSPTATATATPTETRTATPSPTRAPAAPLDFDGDGISDLGVFENQGNDGSLNQLVYASVLSSDGSTVRVEYGKTDDYPVLGDYTGDGIADYAVVKVNELDLEWFIRDGATGDKTSSIFGTLDDTILGGCDFDGDEIVDKAVINSTSFRFEGSSNSEITEVPLTFSFGTVIQSLSCGDIDGNETKELLILLKEKVQASVAGKVSHNRKKRRKKRKRTPTPTPSAYEQYVRAVNLAGDVSVNRSVQDVTGIVVADLNNDGVREIATHAKLTRDISRLKFFSSDTDEPVNLDVSNFNDVSVLKLQASDGNVYDGLQLLTKTDEIKVMNFFDLREEPVFIDADREALTHGVISHATGSNLPEDPEHLCPSVQSASDGNGGFLWKQSDIHASLAVVLPGEFKQQFSQVRVMKDGEFLAGMYFAGWANPDEFGLRQHWRDTVPACSFPDKSILIATRGDSTYCWQIGDSCERND